MSNADTFPKLLLENASRIGDRPACREKDLGIWQTWTWARVADEIRALACGLAALGFRRGDKLIIIGDNRPRLYWGMTAAQALGGVPVPVYQDSAAKEMGFVMGHAEARFALAEDQEQVDKLLEIKGTNQTLESIVYDDARGMRNYDQAFLHDFDKVQEMGRAFDRDNPGFYDDAVAAGKGSDISVMLYTSGTTGNPKGVVLSHSNVMRTAENNERMEGLDADDEILAYLPMAWVGDHIFSFGQNYTAGFCVNCPESAATVMQDFSFGQNYTAGFCVNCPESAATVMQDLRDIGPTYFFAPPRIFENILTSVMVRMEDAAPVKRRIFHYLMAVAQRVGTRILDGKPVSFAEKYAGLQPHPAGLYGGRGDRPGHLRFLPRARHQPETALRDDRGQRLHHGAAGRPDPAGYGRRAGAGGGGEDRRQRRSAVPRTGKLPGILQEPGGDIGGQGSGRVGPHRRCRGVHRRRTPENHRQGEGRGTVERRHARRPEIYREQAEILPEHQGSGGLRPSARLRRRVHQYRPGRHGQLGGTA
jgi:hypothetical protein